MNREQGSTDLSLITGTMGDRYQTSSQAYGAFHGEGKKNQSSVPKPGSHARESRPQPAGTRGQFPRDQYHDHGHGQTRDYKGSYQPHLEPHHTSPHHVHGHTHLAQDQAQARRQRSTQASKQMAYDVFGNVITALETFEDRHERNRHEKSNISIPSQSFKNDEDVKASIQAQLRVFEAHLKHCPPDVRDEVRPQMKKMTADWMAARKTRGTTETDRYAANLFEILGKGTTTHDPIPTQKTMGREELLDNFGKIVHGQSKADALDRGFERNPNRQARAPDVRKGGSTEQGLKRLEQVNSSLARYTDDLSGYTNVR